MTPYSHVAFRVAMMFSAILRSLKCHIPMRSNNCGDVGQPCHASASSSGGSDTTINSSGGRSSATASTATESTSTTTIVPEVARWCQLQLHDPLGPQYVLQVSLRLFRSLFALEATNNWSVVRRYKRRR